MVKPLLKRLLTYAALGLAGALLVGAAGIVAFERSVESRVDALEASGALPQVPYERHPAGPRIVGEIERLSQELQLAIGSASALGVPPCVQMWWTDDHRDELARQVAAAEPVLACFDTLMESKDVRAILDRHAVAVDIDNQPFVAKLGGQRYWVNVLAGRAIVQARQGNERAAVQSLVHACELALLADYGSSWSFILQDITIGYVARGAERILEESPAIAPLLQRELDPVLALCDSPQHAYMGYAFDTARFANSVEATHTSPWRRAGYALAIDTRLDLLDEPFPPSLYRERFSAADLDPTVHSWSALGRTWWAHRRRSAVLRVTLALLAHRELTGSWPASLHELIPRFVDGEPTDPETGGPLRYTAGTSIVVLSPEVVVEGAAHRAFEWRALSESEAPLALRSVW